MRVGSSSSSSGAAAPQVPDIPAASSSDSANGVPAPKQGGNSHKNTSTNWSADTIKGVVSKDEARGNTQELPLISQCGGELLPQLLGCFLLLLLLLFCSFAAVVLSTACLLLARKSPLYQFCCCPATHKQTTTQAMAVTAPSMALAISARTAPSWATPVQKASPASAKAPTFGSV